MFKISVSKSVAKSEISSNDYNRESYKDLVVNNYMVGSINKMRMKMDKVI
jgi:hypothetical protein